MSSALRRRFLAALLLSLLPHAARAEQVYTFGVVPQLEPRKLAAIWTPILRALEERTGLSFKMVGSPSIPNFEAEFEAGRFDFAYMNPYHSMIAFRTQQYEPLLRDGGKQLYGVLVTRKDSLIKSIQDLDGKQIAFPAPNALGASMMIRADLDHTHHIRTTPLWAQSHSSAYLNAALGRADAAGGVMTTLLQQPPAVRDRLRILYETRRIAPHPIVAHPRVPPAVRERVRSAFLAMAATTQGQALLAQIPMEKPVVASVSDYQELATMGLEKYYLKGGD
jgi:phosphonate transport system substrate-binding protein